MNIFFIQFNVQYLQRLLNQENKYTLFIVSTVNKK